MSAAAAAPPDQEEAPTGLVGRFLGRGKKYKKAKLGEELAMYYNEELKCWLMKGEEDAKRKELAALNAPPPFAKQASLDSQQPNGEGLGPTVGPPPMPSLGAASKPLGVASRYAMAPTFRSTGPTGGSLNSLAPPMHAFGALKPVTFGGSGSSVPSNIATFRPVVPSSGNPDDGHNAAGWRKPEVEEEKKPEAAETRDGQAVGRHLVEEEFSDAAAASIDHGPGSVNAEEREPGELQEGASFELSVGTSRQAPASPAAWPPNNPIPRANWGSSHADIEQWREDPIFQEILAFWSVYRAAGYSAEAMAAWTKEHYDPPQASVDYEAALGLADMHALAQEYVEQHPNISRANSPQPEGVGEPGPAGLEPQTHFYPPDQQGPYSGQASSVTTATWIPPPGDEQQQTETWHDDQPGFRHEPGPNEVPSADEHWSTVHANEVFGLPGSTEKAIGTIGYPSEDGDHKTAYDDGSIYPEDLDAGSQIPNTTSYVETHQSVHQTARMLRFSPVPEEEEGADEVEGGYAHDQGFVEEVAGPSEERGVADQPQSVFVEPPISHPGSETVVPGSSDGARTGFEEAQEEQSSLRGFTEIVGGMVGDLFDHGGSGEPLSGKLETRLAWEQDETYDESMYYDDSAEAGEQQEHQQPPESSSEAVQSDDGNYPYYHQTTLSETEVSHHAPGTTALFSQPIIANALNWFSDNAAPGELTQHLRPLVTAEPQVAKNENDEELLAYPGDGAQLSPGRLASELGIPKSALLSANAPFGPSTGDLDSLSSRSVEEVESAAPGFENGDVEEMPNFEQKEIAEEGWEDEDLDSLTRMEDVQTTGAPAGPSTEEGWPAVAEQPPQEEGWQEFDAFPETDELPAALEPTVATVYPWSEEAHETMIGGVAIGTQHGDQLGEEATTHMDGTTHTFRSGAGEQHDWEDMLIPSQEQEQQIGVPVAVGAPGAEQETKQVPTENACEGTVLSKHIAEQRHTISPALEEELSDLRARLAAAEETLSLERAQRASEATAAQALAEQQTAVLMSVRERLAEAREEMMEAQEDLARAQEETARVREEGAQRESATEQELADVKAKLDAVNAEMQAVVSELRESQQPVVPPEVEAELAAAHARIDELKETLDAERRSRQNALTAAQREAERLRDQLEDAEDEAEAARESAARRVQEALRDVRDRVRAAVEQKEADLRKLIETGTSELEAAQDAARAAEAERDEAKLESEALRSRCDELAKKFAVAKKKIAALQSSASEAREKLTLLEGAETELANRDAEIKNLLGQLQEAQELHTRLEEGLDRQRAEHAQEIEALEEENLKLMDMLEEKTERATLAAEELEKAIASNNSLAAELEGSTAKTQVVVSELETAKSQLKSVQDELDDAREQLEDAATGLSDEARMEMENELAALKMELERERERRSVVEKSMHELETQLEASTSREQVLGSRLLEAQEEAELAKAESVGMLEAEVKDLRELVQSLRAEVESSTAAAEEEIKRYRVQLIKAKKARKADAERIEELTRKCQELEEELRSLEEKNAREQGGNDVNGVVGGPSTIAAEQEEATFQLQSRVAALERELEASQQEVLEAMSVAERAVADLDEAAEQRHEVERRLAEAEAKLAEEDKGVAVNEEEAEEQLELCLASLGQEEAKVLALREELVNRGVDEDWIEQLLARIEDETGWGSDAIGVDDVEPEAEEDAPVYLPQHAGDPTAFEEEAKEDESPAPSLTATSWPPVDHHIIMEKDSPQEHVVPASHTVLPENQDRDPLNEGVVEIGEDTGLPDTLHEKDEEPSVGLDEQGASPAAWQLQEEHDEAAKAGTSDPVWQSDMHDVYQQALYATDTSDPHALFGGETATTGKAFEDSPHEVNAAPPLFAPVTSQPQSLTVGMFADDGDDVAFFYENNGAPTATTPTGGDGALLSEHFGGRQEELWPGQDDSQDDVTVANQQEETTTQHLTSPPSGVASATWDDFPQPPSKDPGFLEDVALGDHDNESQFRPIPFSTQRPTSREGWSDNDDLLI